MPDDVNLPAQWAKEDTSHIEVKGAAGDLDDFSQPMILYADRRQAITKLNRRMMFLVPLVGIYVFMLVSIHMYIIAALLLAQVVLMYLWVVRNFNKTTTPLMQIDASGITVHGLVTHLHMDWDNLKEVRPYTFVYKFVGMDAKNIWKLNASVPQKLFLTYNSLVRFVYRLFGVKLHGINVPEQYSHFKAEEICEQIEKRRVHYLGLPNNQNQGALLGKAEAQLPNAQPEATLKLPESDQVKLKLPNSED